RKGIYHRQQNGVSLIEYRVKRTLVVQTNTERHLLPNAVRFAQQVDPNFSVLGGVLQVKLQMVLTGVNFQGVVSVNREPVQIGNKLRRIVLLGPLFQMIDLHANEVIQLEVSFDAGDLRFDGRRDA